MVAMYTTIPPLLLWDYFEHPVRLLSKEMMEKLLSRNGNCPFSGHFEHPVWLLSKEMMVKITKSEWKLPIFGPF